MNGHGETVVLDSRALSAWIAEDRRILRDAQVFHFTGSEIVVGADTGVEVGHARVNLPRLWWCCPASRGRR